MCGRSLCGNREVSRPTKDGSPSWSAAGRRRAVAADARVREVRPGHSSDEACEQSRATGGGVGGAKGRGRGKRASATQARGAGPGKRVTALERVREVARQRKKERFTALFHHLNQSMLRTAFALKRDAAPGIDGLTWQTYEVDLVAGSRTCINGSIEERTGRSHHDVGIFRNRMAASVRSRSPRWKPLPGPRR